MLREKVLVVVKKDQDWNSFPTGMPIYLRYQYFLVTENSQVESANRMWLDPKFSDKSLKYGRLEAIMAQV